MVDFVNQNVYVCVCSHVPFIQIYLKRSVNSKIPIFLHSDYFDIVNPFLSLDLSSSITVHLSFHLLHDFHCARQSNTIFRELYALIWIHCPELISCKRNTFFSLRCLSLIKYSHQCSCSSIRLYIPFAEEFLMIIMNIISVSITTVWNINERKKRRKITREITLSMASAMILIITIMISI